MTTVCPLFCHFKTGHSAIQVQLAAATWRMERKRFRLKFSNYSGAWTLRIVTYVGHV